MIPPSGSSNLPPSPSRATPTTPAPPTPQIGTSGTDDCRGLRRRAAATRALSSAGAAGTFAAGGSDANATIASFDATTQHNIPKAFNDYRTKAGLLTIGLAIAEPFWANGVLVGGQPKDVLVQAFERRVLTYTPSNPDAFKVEFGNIGSHYFTWRYMTNAGGGTGTTTGGTGTTTGGVSTTNPHASRSRIRVPLCVRSTLTSPPSAASRSGPCSKTNW